MQPPASTKPVWSWKRALLFGVSALVGTFLIGLIGFTASMGPDGNLRAFTESWTRFSLYPGAAAFAASWLRQTGRGKTALWIGVVFAALTLTLLAVALLGNKYKPTGPFNAIVPAGIPPTFDSELEERRRL